MATKLSRKLQKIFATSATNTGVFGSAQTGTKVESTDLDDIQGLAAYNTGWLDATISAKNLPPIEEMQGLQYMMTTQLKYLFQNGVAEYLDTEEYFISSIVRKTGTTEFYKSLINNNIGNALPVQTDDTNWKYCGDLESLSSAGVPTGVIQLWGTTTAPLGYFTCDGSAVSRTTYASLFAIIGDTFGAGDGSTTFNVPDYRGRVPVGYKSGDSDFGNMGQTGGEKEHTLTGAESGTSAHSHSLESVSGDGPVATGGGYLQNATNSTAAPKSTNSTAETDALEAHNNLQPYLTTNIIIKY